ncbi:MAG: 3-deoxy-manno-octulosonate cytidylyltransferase [Saezia sp.]
MEFHVIIPARLKSTRLPNKPLADIHGLPMIVRVAQQAAKSDALSVTVAADDDSVVQICKTHGVKAILTDAHHPSGSDRLAQASTLLGLQPQDIVVNVQGDEPLISENLINACAQQLQKNADCAISTAAHAIESSLEYANPNVVKVVCDAKGKALYFSRAPIPWWRDGNLQKAAGSVPELPDASLTFTGLQPLRHIGIYAYRVDFLQRFPTLTIAPIEQLESLEQLRAMWHGERIAVFVTDEPPGPGVDTPEDLERVRTLLAQTD